MEYISERITIDDIICSGKPTIRGMRISVQTILEFLSAGDTTEYIFKNYPMLEHDDINSCLKLAGDLLSRSFIIKPVA